MSSPQAFLPVSISIFIGLFLFSGCLLIDLDDEGATVRNTDSVARASFSFEVAVQNHTQLRLEAVNGVVEVAGRANARSVRITGERRVGSESLRDAERHLDEVDVRVEDLGDEVFVRTVQPRQSEGRNYVVDYTITLPRDLDVVVDHVNGNVTVESVDAFVAVGNVNGNVGLTDIFGSAAVRLVNGNIGSEVTLPLDGALTLETANGNIGLVIPSSTSATFSASVTNGAISTSNLVLRNLVSTPRSLRGTLGAGAGTIELRTVNGNIEAVGRN